MKKILILFICLSILSASMTSCAGVLLMSAVNKDETVETSSETTEKVLPDVPEGYQAFNNGELFFAYPEDWYTAERYSNGVKLSATNGYTQVWVEHERAPGTFGYMTKHVLRREFVVPLEEQGWNITDYSTTNTWDAVKNPNDLYVTECQISGDHTESGATLEVVIYSVTVGENEYSIYISDTQRNPKAENVIFDTLASVK